MISKAFLIFITIIGIAYHALTIDLIVGDVALQMKVWHLGALFFAICISYLVLKKLVKKVFSAFQWYRAYLESFDPSRAIMVVIDHKLNLKKHIQIEYKDLSPDKKIYLELIKFLIGQRVSRKILDQNLHGNTLHTIQQIEYDLQGNSYVSAARALEGLAKEYGYIQWIYSNLRHCYLETKSFQELDEMNSKVSNVCLGSINRNEAKIMSLKIDLEHTREISKKLLILEKIYKLDSKDSDNLMKYLHCLQNLGHFAAGINIIKHSTESSPDFIKLSSEFFDTQEPELAARNALEMRDSVLKYVLLFNASLKKNDIDLAEHAILKLSSSDSTLSNLLQLRLYNELADTKKLHTTVKTLSNVYASYDTKWSKKVD